MQIDYCFFKALEDEAPWPVLLGWSSKSGGGVACVARHKGREDPNPTRVILKWLDEQALHGKIRLRSDPEASIMSVAQDIAARRVQSTPESETLVETTTVQSHSSIGGVERYAATIGGACRTLVQEVQELTFVLPEVLMELCVLGSRRRAGQKTIKAILDTRYVVGV